MCGNAGYIGHREADSVIWTLRAGGVSGEALTSK